MILYPWKGIKFKWDVNVDEALDWIKLGDDNFWQNLNNCFKVPYQKIMELIFIFGKELRQQYSEVLKMPWYEIEMLWHVYEEYIEEQNKQNTLENKRYEEEFASMKSTMPNQNSINRMMQDQQNNFKMPDMSNIGNIGNLNNF